MITKETVFVLGAGASWHYGYPTGEGLIDHVIRIARQLRTHCTWRVDSGSVEVAFVPRYIQERIDGLGREPARKAWRMVHNECQQLIDRLETVRPLVIDYFLAWNESLRPIGKLMIATAILECEARWIFLRRNVNHVSALIGAPIQQLTRHFDKIPNGRDDWYRFIVHKLVYGCQKSDDIVQNKVRFVTFNYDTSLEYNLYRALTAIDLFQPNDITTFLTRNRIVHVYGAVHEGVPGESDAIDLTFAQQLGEAPTTVTQEWLRGTETLLNRYRSAGEALLTINPHDKDGDKASLKLARNWIGRSEVVYILGYGFDPNNSRRIGLDKVHKRAIAMPTVMFTNYDDINTVNKRAANQFGLDQQAFIESSLVNFDDHGYGEKSVRTVYEALEKDFDAIEGE